MFTKEGREAGTNIFYLEGIGNISALEALNASKAIILVGSPRSPTIEITVRKFVITVAAQKLICPQGKTYPRKAVRKVNKNNTTPVNHTSSLPVRYPIEA